MAPKRAFKYKPKSCKKCNKTFCGRATWCNNCRTIICKTCRETALITVKRLKKGRVLYCSNNCRQRKTEKNEQTCKRCKETFFAGPKVTWCDTCCTVNCNYCTNDFLAKPNQIKQGTAKYCSKECKANAEASYTITPEDEKFICENYPHNISWKTLVYKYKSPNRIKKILKKHNLKTTKEARGKRVSEHVLKYSPDQMKRVLLESHKSDIRTRGELWENHGGLMSAMSEQFGSIDEGLEHLGLADLFPKTRKKWNPDTVSEVIVKRWRENKSLRSSKVKADDPKLFSAANRYYKSWKQAVNNVLNYDEVINNESNRRLDWKGKDGHIYPSKGECKVADKLYELRSSKKIKDYKPHVRVTNNRRWTCDFLVKTNQGHSVWLEYDGLKDRRTDGGYNNNHPKIEYYKKKSYIFLVVDSEQNLLKRIEDVASEAGSNFYLTGQWDDFYSVGKYQYTEEDIINELKTVAQKSRKRALTKALFDKYSNKMTSQTVSNRLGWNNALVKADLLPFENAPRSILIEELKRIGAILGKRPTCREFSRYSDYNAARYETHFGSWSKALKAAGYDIADLNS